MAAPKDGDAPLTPEEAASAWKEEAAARSAASDPAPVGSEAFEEIGEKAEAAPVVEAKPATDLPSEFLAQLASMQAAQQQMLHKLSSAEGRVAAMHREFEQARQARESVAAAPSNQAMQTALKSPEKWKALKEDFPEWGEAVEALVSENFVGGPAASTEALRKEFADHLSAVTNGLKADLSRQLAEDRVEARHEGWRDLVKTPAFSGWIAAQKPEVQALGSSEEPRDAIRMLDLFKQAQQAPATDIKQQRQTRLQAAARTERMPTAPAVVRSDADLTPEQIWRQEAERRARANAA
jgi:hypothetical protein